jgi:hypothetical protein
MSIFTRNWNWPVNTRSLRHARHMLKSRAEPGFLVRFRQPTVVSCIQKSARGGSSNQSAAIVFWHSTMGQAKKNSDVKSDQGVVKCLPYTVSVFFTKPDHNVFVTACSIPECHILSAACQARYHERVLGYRVLFRVQLCCECTQYDLTGNLLDLFTNGSAELSHTRTFPCYIALHCSISLF